VQSSPESKVSQLEVYAADSTTYTQEMTMITVALAGTKDNSCAKAKEEKTIALHCHVPVLLLFRESAHHSRFDTHVRRSC